MSAIARRRTWAHEERRSGPQGILSTLFRQYQLSSQFDALRPSTRAEYVRHIAKIERAFGTLPLAALDDRRTRGVILDWRDQIARRSPRQADHLVAVLRLVLAWSVDRGLIARNPIERPGRVHTATRAEKIWRDADLAALEAVASPEIWLAVTLAVETGQRQGDLLRLPWSAWDGAHLTLRQSKTGKRVDVRATRRLREALGRAPRLSTLILTSSRGRPWTADGFKTSFGKAKAAAKIEGLTFHDLRGTAATRLAEAGASAIQIAAVTGHSVKDVDGILERHYVAPTRALGDAAIERLENARAAKTSNQSSNRAESAPKIDP